MNSACKYWWVPLIAAIALDALNLPFGAVGAIATAAILLFGGIFMYVVEFAAKKGLDSRFRRSAKAEQGKEPKGSVYINGSARSIGITLTCVISIVLGIVHVVAVPFVYLQAPGGNPIRFVLLALAALLLCLVSCVMLWRRLNQLLSI